MEKNARMQPILSEGLTLDQVLQQKEKGFDNSISTMVTKSNLDIIRDNVFTLFNFLNFFIALCLALVGAYANMVFLSIIIINICIGIYQEIHARNLVEKLSLLAAAKATVRRQGREESISVKELVQDDIILLRRGNQICVDSIVMEGDIEVNESLLTGESNYVFKKTGDFLYSGSYIVSGHCTAQVEHVGDENYSYKLAKEVKKHKNIKSELIDSMRKVTSFTSLVILPLGLILFLEAYYKRSDTLFIAVVSTAAALLGMLPKGLVLLISISLAGGVIKLAKKDILVQEMHCIETLAHVDTLCLDKTGTLTEGIMSVVSIEYLQNNIKGLPIEEAMGAFFHANNELNATAMALRQSFIENDSQIMISRIDFSSERKWSAVTFVNLGTIILGAPEKLLDNGELLNSIREKENQGYRILLVAHTDGEITIAYHAEITPLVVIGLCDPIRKDARQTLELFKQEGVNIKIISGDSPATVATISQQAGFDAYESCVDLSQVESEQDVQAAAQKYSIFGRVSPQQKKQLIMAFQKQGRIVAMTGDGVNDVLALRQADCSIAMANGDDAAKQISQLILLQSEFSKLPEVLAEGRRVIHNMTKVSSIFFIKTIYSVILSALGAVFGFISGFTFPFIPIQILINDIFIESYPSFFLSFEPNNKRVTGKFLRSAIGGALPNGLMAVGYVLVMELLSSRFGISPVDKVTLMLYLVGFVSIMGVLKACLPFNRLRAFLFVSALLGYYLTLYILRGILHLGVLSATTFPIFIIMAFVSILSFVVRFRKNQ